jgi:putative ABC transport system ATP-binding protein
MDLCNLYTRGERRERGLHLLSLVNLADQANELPPRLSGGQQQRAAIARALANDPALLVGDEPTGNLDRHTAVEMFDLFESLRGEGKTILIVTHDRELSVRTRRVIRLLDGCIEKDHPNGKARLP